MAITTFAIAQRQPILGGRAFGDAGAYEKVAGTLTFAVDPRHPLHAEIVDLDRAPTNAAGRVEFSADVYLLRPVEPARGNGALLLDLPNRGRKVGLGMLNSAVRTADPTTAEDFGNGFLMRHGYTVAWVGWQPDVPRVDGLMALQSPVARGVTGQVRCEFRPNAAAARLPLADRYHVPQPTLALDDPDARLTVRRRVADEPRAIPRAAWRFPDPTHVELDGGFVPGSLYELVYRAADPSIVGLGFLAVRDTAAWLRFGDAASANPCAGTLRRAYALGVSQSGRFLRHFLFLGQNQDEAGRRVFDGVMPHVASARRGEFNMRFGQPSLNAKRSAGSLFPFTDVEQADPLTGARGSLLAGQAARGGLPKIIATNTAAEYWQGDGSLVHTDVEARVDVDTVPEARVYLFAGSHHSPGSVPPLQADPNTGGRGRHRFNAVDYAPLLRAALVNLDAWVRDGVAPPPSAVPRLADGTAVPAETTEKTFTAIPGVRFPDQIERPVRLDFGPRGARGVCTTLPPAAGAPYASVVSALDADGNEIAGIRPAELRVPVATFSGWNVRHPDQGAPGDLMSMIGSTLPFCRTADERARSGDPRPSLAERYPSRDAYLVRVRAACRELVALRHMLAEDVDAAVARAGRLYDWVQAGA
jgi:hypothetical protein